MNAPGAFWISVLPFLGGMSLGRKGFYLGMGLLLITVLTFYILNTLNLNPNIFLNHPDYFRIERMRTLIAFFIFTGVITFSYLKYEAFYFKKLSYEKKKNEELLRILFHDVANPIFSIQMRAFNILKHTQEEETKKYIESIHQSSKHIAMLLDQVRSLKSINDGKTDLELENVCLEDALEQSIKIVQDKALLKNINFVRKINMEKNFSVEANRVHLIFQVLCNVLTNAIKFSPQNSKIYLSIYEEEGEYVLEVKDKGIGMPESTLKNIFLDNHKTTRLGTDGEMGTGYGMPLVKSFMDLFNGGVQVYSQEKKNEEVDHGTTVRLTFRKSDQGHA